MKTIVTKPGLELLREKLSEKIKQLKSIREEKAHAYSASGDGWHDNPGWIQLGQQEEMLAVEVSLLQQKITNAVLIDPATQDSTKVQIGCIVDFHLFRNGTPVGQSIRIVGTGETDVKNRCISYDSPMGQALCNMKVDEEKEVLLPIGKVKVKVYNIRYE